MNEKEEKVLKTITDALPNMSDFDKGYMLGKAEGMVDVKKESKKQDTKDTETSD